MSMYEFKATNLISETFEQRGVKFDVVKYPDSEHLLAGFSVQCGPSVMMRFISRDDDNDVAVRIYGLIANTPKEKRFRIMEACNSLNCKLRYVKFYCAPDGDINVEYDFPASTPDDGAGEMAFEIFVRMMQILNDEYGIFMKALYSDDELDPQALEISDEQIQRLQEEIRMMAQARMAALGEIDDPDGFDPFDLHLASDDADD